MADKMAVALQVTPEFVAEWAPTTLVYPLGNNSEGKFNEMSFSVDNAVVRNGLEQHVTPHTKPLIDQLEAFDGELCWSGLHYLASRRERAVIRIASPVVSFWGPHEPKKARLMGGLLESVRAAQQISSLATENLKQKTAKEAEKRTLRLAKTVGVVVLSHPDKVFLATDTPTTEQVEAISQLSEKLTKRDKREVEELVVSTEPTEETVDFDAWQHKLRHFHLRWLSEEEYDEERNSWDEMMTSIRMNLKAEREGL